MATNWEAQNIKVFKAATKEFLNKDFKAQVLGILRNIAIEIVETINNVPSDGTDELPIYTGNMLDGTGVAIYDNGAITTFIPQQFARGPQFMNGYPFDIWGNEMLQDAINEGVSTYNKGLWFVLFSATPYAYDVTHYGSPAGRGYGFFEHFKQQVLTDINKSKLFERV